MVLCILLIKCKFASQHQVHLKRFKPITPLTSRIAMKYATY